MDKIILPNLLVVGGTGFIGYHLILAAKKEKWKVASLSLNKPKSYRYVSGVNYIRTDISNFKKLKKKLRKSYDYVVNLGGYGVHTFSKKEENEEINAHFVGLVNLTKIFSRKKIRKFIQIGSSEEYGNARAPQSELTHGSPISPYALAKLAATRFLVMLNNIEKYPVIILRFFLVYGSQQDNNRILPQIISGCLKNKKFPVSKGDQIRDFCYVDDAVKAIILALKSKKINGEIFNIGSGRPIKIKKVINQICKKIGRGKPQFGKIKYRKGENMKLYPSIKKARAKLKWKPRISFDRGLQIVINSHK